MKKKQYRNYIVQIDCFGHDRNGNAIAHHSVFGTDNMGNVGLPPFGVYGAPILYRTRKRPQVGFGSDCDDYAMMALEKAHAPVGEKRFTMTRQGDRGAGMIYLIYTFDN